MNTIIDLLRNHPQITDWKINIHRKESYELFFVKEKLETLRRTDTCDKLVTVYVCHGEFLGDSQFYVFPSTTREELKTLIDEAAAKALLINNPPYTLPAEETGTFSGENQHTHNCRNQHNTGNNVHYRLPEKTQKSQSQANNRC